MSSDAFDPARLGAIVARFPGRKIAVLGDLMLDRYLWGRVERISPEAPVPVVEVESESESLGGAGNVAMNLRALGAEPVLIGALGADAAGEQLRDTLSRGDVDVRTLIVDAGRPTTVKTRIIAHSQQVVRADRESRADLAGEPLDRLLELLERELPGCHGLLISDYGKGVVQARSLEAALPLARRHGIAVSVDPKESHIDAYRGVSILTPNQHEAGYVQGKRVVDETTLHEVGWGLQRRLDAEAVLVTRGGEGMSLFERGGRYTYLPTVAREVYDVTGAGDTVVSVVALALAAGADYPSACFISNHAAGLVVSEIGTTACTSAELLASLDGRR